MIATSPFTKEAQEEMQEHFRNCHRYGYEEGYSGKGYSGETFIGYYGWLSGRDKEPPLYGWPK